MQLCGKELQFYYLVLESALQAKCDAFVTINLRDYSGADTSKIEILSPAEFVGKYL